MPCIPSPTLPIPDFPAGFSFAAPAPPALNVAANICCKQIGFGYTPKIPLGSVAINIGVLLAVKAAAEALRLWISQLPLKCPREA